MTAAPPPPDPRKAPPFEARRARAAPDLPLRVEAAFGRRTHLTKPAATPLCGRGTLRRPATRFRRHFCDGRADGPRRRFRHFFW